MTVKFYVPSYLDTMDVRQEGQNFKALADSITHFGPLRFRKVQDGYTINKKDMDWCLRLDEAGTVYVPEDLDFSDDDFPVGSQVAVLNNTAQRVKVAGIGAVQIIGAERLVIEKWRVGVLVKNGANFWLLSLGSGAGGNAKPVPSEPKLTQAVPGVGSASLAWTKPDDDGGSPIVNYVIESSLDQKAWKVAATVEANVLTHVVTGLVPSVNYFRVKASNENGFSEPSNIMSCNPTMAKPTLEHTANGQFTITNYNKDFQYVLSGDGASLAGQIVTFSAANGTVDVICKFVETSTQTSQPITRQQYTYHWQGGYNQTNFYNHGDPCHPPTCPPCPQTGHCIGACSYDPRPDKEPCNHSEGDTFCTQVKDSTPAGFTDEFGEWAKVI